MLSYLLKIAYETGWENIITAKLEQIRSDEKLNTIVSNIDANTRSWYIGGNTFINGVYIPGVVVESH